MHNAKSALIALTLAVAVSAGCDQKQGVRYWEYHVVEFDRDEAQSMPAKLKDLGDKGWEYAGPLANNGINSQFVAFKRPKE